MSRLDINIIDKSYRTPLDRNPKQVIKNLNIHIGKSEFVCLVGPSGCGKTTLLNILAGLDTHFTGTIKLASHPQQPKVSYIFQNPRLLPWRTVHENIQLASDASEKSLDFLYKNMGLENEKNSYPEHLSLGMSRRVSIIRAFATEPDLLLMDEPFVSLDPPTARQVRQLLISLWCQRPHKILYVTHDLREAIALADRLIFLNSKPMSSIREINISLSREERKDELKIEKFKQQIALNYPDITALL